MSLPIVSHIFSPFLVSLQTPDDFPSVRKVLAILIKRNIPKSTLAHAPKALQQEPKYSPPLDEKKKEQDVTDLLRKIKELETKNKHLTQNLQESEQKNTDLNKKILKVQEESKNDLKKTNSSIGMDQLEINKLKREMEKMETKHKTAIVALEKKHKEALQQLNDRLKVAEGEKKKVLKEKMEITAAAAEEKKKKGEKDKPAAIEKKSSPTPSTSAQRKVGGSIADRINNLQNLDLSKGPTPLKKTPSPVNTAISTPVKKTATTTGASRYAKTAGPAGRRPATRNTLVAKKELEKRAETQRAKGDTKPKPRASAAAIGGFGILAAVNAKGNDRKLNSVSKKFGGMATATDEAEPAWRKQLKSGTSMAEVKPYIEEGFVVKLIHIKGRRNVRTRVVETSWKSLNNGDVYILDCGNTLYLWNGSHANRMERAKGVDVANRIKNKDRNTRATIVQLEENDDCNEFWKHLGGKHVITDHSKTDTDEVADKQQIDILYKLIQKNGSLRPEVVPGGRPKKDSLVTDGCFILDSKSEVYLWSGRQTNLAQKKEAVGCAVEMLKSDKSRPKHSKVVKISEGVESTLFKEKFADFGDLPISVSARPPPKGNVSNVSDERFDVAKMYNVNPEKSKLLDENADGKIEIWHVKEFEKDPVPVDHYGEFFSGESYIILYTYTERWKECYAIYFWQGRNSSVTEKGTSAMLTRDLDEHFQNEARQIRIVQNQEDLHFRLLFKDNMIVHLGNQTSTFRPEGDIHMYHISCSNFNSPDHLISYAIEVPPEVQALNSNDCYLLSGSGKMYIWNGQHALVHKKRSAKLRADILKGSLLIEIIQEGREPDGFWSLLGGKPSGSEIYFAQQLSTQPKLYHCSNSSGRFEALPVFNLCQDDLNNGDMMLLDTKINIYVWVGQKANESEKKKALHLAQEYIDNHPQKNLFKQPVELWAIFSGREHHLFTALFHGWDSTNATDRIAATRIPIVDVIKDYSRSFSLEELQKRPRQLEQTTLEMYLSDADFLKYFGLPKNEFEKLGPWKREQLKRSLELF